MATTIFIIPLCNPCKPIPQSDALQSDAASTQLAVYHPSYNYRDIDSDFYFRNLQPWEDKRAYHQPYQQSETLRLIWFGSDTTLANYQYARMLRPDGSVLSKTVTVQTNGTNYNGLRLYWVEIKLFDVPEGIYMPQLRHKDAGNNYIGVLFEPIHVKARWNNTLLYEYSNSYSAQGVIYPSASFVFQLRVHGWLKVSPKNTSVGYENQTKNYELLSGIPYRDVDIHMYHIPRWYADVINRAIQCDTVKINGKQVSKPTESELKSSAEDGTLSDYMVTLRERINSTTLDLGHSYAIVCAMPQTRLFWVEKITYAGVPTTVNVRRGFTGKLNFLDFLNSTYPITNGYWGEDDNGNLIQFGDFSEAATIVAGDLLPYGLQFTILGGGDFNFTYYLGSISSAYYAIEYGDGTASVNKTSLAAFTNPVHTYSDFKLMTHTVYFTDCAGIEDTGTLLAIESIYGDLPPNMSDVRIYNAQSCLTEWKNNPFEFIGEDILTYVWLENQCFSTFELDNIIRNVYTCLKAFNVTCEVYINSQIPVTAPSKHDPAILNLMSAIKSKLAVFQHD